VRGNSRPGHYLAAHGQALGLLAVLTFTLLARLPELGRSPFYEDEAISLRAIEGLLERGVPTLPSGAQYLRSPLHLLLLTPAVALFGGHSPWVRLPSLLLFLLTLLLSYQYLSRLRDGPTALGAVLLLCGLHSQSEVALSVRMYAVLQTSTLLALYLHQRFLDERTVRLRRAWFLSLLALVASHELGLLTAVTLFVHASYQQVREGHLDRSFLLSSLLVAALTLVCWFPPLPSLLLEVTTHSTRQTPALALVTSFQDPTLSEYPRLLAACLPWLWPFSLLGGLCAIRPARAHLRPLAAVTGINLLALSLLAFKTSRYATVLVPLVAALAVLGLSEALCFLLFLLRRLFPGGCTVKAERLGSRVGFVLLALWFPFAAHLPDSPVQFGVDRPDLAPAHRYLADRRKASEPVVTSNSWMTQHYLGDFDFFLRQRYRHPEGWGPFPVAREEYYDRPVLDTIEEWFDLLRRHPKVWLLADDKLREYTSPAMLEVLDRTCVKVFHGQHAAGTEVFQCKQ